LANTRPSRLLRYRHAIGGLGILYILAAVASWLDYFTTILGPGTDSALPALQAALLTSPAGLALIAIYREAGRLRPRKRSDPTT